MASDHKTNLSDPTIFISKTKKGTYDLIFFNMPFNGVPNIVKGDVYVQWKTKSFQNVANRIDKGIKYGTCNSFKN